MVNEIINYINVDLRRRAFIITKDYHTSCDIVQDVFLSFLLHPEYSLRPIDEQKKIAITILKNRERKVSGRHFYVSDVSEFREFSFDDNNVISKHRNVIMRKNGFLNQPTENYEVENKIDYKNLLCYMKEREDKCINMFWLFNIGYKIKEIAAIYRTEIRTAQSAIVYGKKKMLAVFKKNKFIRLSRLAVDNKTVCYS